MLMNQDHYGFYKINSVEDRIVWKCVVTLGRGVCVLIVLYRDVQQLHWCVPSRWALVQDVY